MMAILVSFACSFAPGEEGEARGSNNCSSPACLSVWKGICIYLTANLSSYALSLQPEKKRVKLGIRIIKVIAN
jgi:hypothetical protein